MRIICLGILWAMLSGFVYHSATSPLVFTREVVRVIPAAPPASDTAESPPRQPLEYLLEMRDERALQLEEMHSLTQLKETTGVMLYFQQPMALALPKLNVSAELDVLFVNEQGTIMQMLPGHVPIQSHASLIAELPVKAWIYLDAGQIAARDIRPGDRVEASIFTPPPAMIK
jgi:uncharacterized membrane protein (UPF0127 family)